MTDRADSERYKNIAAGGSPRGGREMPRWPTTYSARTVRTNGVLVRVAGPKRRIQVRLAAFPDLTTTIEDMFSAPDKIATRLVWRGTYSGSYRGVKATGKRWRSETLLFGVSKKARRRKCP